MFISYEQKVALDEVIYDTIKDSPYLNSSVNTSIIIVQDPDKYESTAYEAHRMAIVDISRLPKDEYHFNLGDNLYDKFGNSLVDYYESLERVGYEIYFYPLSNTVKVYDVGYTGFKGDKDSVIRTLVREVSLQTKIDFKKKVVATVTTIKEGN